MGSQPDPNAELDENGLVVHKHLATVLVVLAAGYDEQTLRYARSALFNVSVHTISVAPSDEGLIQGALQDEFQVDQPLEAARMDDYVGLLVCGGPGSKQLADDPKVVELVRAAVQQKKLVAAWGEATSVLAAAGVVKKRKVTGDPSVKSALVAAGAKYTGAQVVVDGNFVTGLDDASGFRFGKALVQVVAIP
ncbi:MAG: DJ-1/PfpI family protein [Planctomycetota bacterium]